MNHDPALSAREVAFLRALAQGKNNAQIADEMALARQSVKNSLSRLYAKVGVHSRTEAAMWAVRHGLLEGTLAAGHRTLAHPLQGDDTNLENAPMPKTEPFEPVCGTDTPIVAADSIPPKLGSADISPRDESLRMRTAGGMETAATKTAVSAILALTLVFGAFWATTATHGRSTMTFPVLSGKVAEVEAFLRARFGDEIAHWVEAVEVTYADGTVDTQPQAYFTFPTPLVPGFSGQLTDIVAERSGSGPYRMEFWKRILASR